MERELDLSLETRAENLKEIYAMGGIEFLRNLVDRRAQKSDPEKIIFYLTNHNYNKLSGNISDWPRAVPKNSGWTEVEDDDENPIEYRYFALTLDDKYHLLLGLDTEKEEEMENRVFLVFLGALALSLVGAAITGFLLHKNINERLGLITATCSEIMVGRFSHRIPVSRTSDEIDEMAHTLNGMLDRIETLMDGIRHVTDSIAHDLRTPLTRLHSRLENLLSKTKSEENRKLVEATIAEVDQLLITFAALLSITRLETGELETNFKEIRLSDLIKDAIDIYEPIAEDKGQEIVLLDNLEERPLLGDRDLITQCFSNLLDNALKYGPKNSTISIRLDQSGSSTVLRVHDQGSGIPDHETEKVLERFYRVESSRNMPGNGLGLSLVAAVVRIHGGTLSMKNKDGFAVTLELPSA